MKHIRTAAIEQTSKIGPESEQYRAGGPPPPPVVTPSTDTEAARFGLRAGLSITPADISALRSLGYEPWLEREIDQPIELTSQQFLSARGFDAKGAARSLGYPSAAPPLF